MTLPIVPADKVDLMKLVLVIDRGFTVAGRITDLEGHPINGAQVEELNNNCYRRQSTMTDIGGAFTLRGLFPEYDSYLQRAAETNPDGTLSIRGMSGMGAPRGLRLIVQSKGYAPQAPTVQLSERTNVVHLTLAAGNIFRGRVADETGHAIPDAVVRTDADNQGLDKFKWRTRTDAEGRFEWDSAPQEPVSFWFEADGFDWLRHVPLVADRTDHEIRLIRKSTD